jgi:hypothetical protein
VTILPVIGRCDTCGQKFVHIAFDGVECPYLDCAGKLHFDDTPEGRAYRAQMEQQEQAPKQAAP